MTPPGLCSYKSCIGNVRFRLASNSRDRFLSQEAQAYLHSTCAVVLGKASTMDMLPELICADTRWPAIDKRPLSERSLQANMQKTNTLRMSFSNSVGLHPSNPRDQAPKGSSSTYCARVCMIHRHASALSSLISVFPAVGRPFQLDG